MAKKKKRNRSRRTPNVYVQPQREHDDLMPPVAMAEAVADVSEGSSSDAPRPAPDANVRPRASRVTQTTRSDVYAVSIPNEMRKMGVLAAGLVVALVVFSVVLG